MTEISKLGEFGLINHLTSDIKPKNKETICGIGDDCAVLNYQNRQLLVTTDMLMEGVHFDLTYMPLKHLGYKSAMVNFSDIFAMGGMPKQITISMAISKRFSVEDMEDFYAGLQLACDKWGVDIIGGDTTSSLTGMAISITAIGEASDTPILRKGAQPTNLICVSGDLGAAYMGLQLLEREKAVYYQQLKDNPNDKSDFQPEFAGKEYIIERQLKPEARGDIIAKLNATGIHPTAMIDISDGLSSELLHICTQSHCGCRIYEKELPIDYQTAVMAEELGMNVTTFALNGGEDYELLFTVPIGNKEKIESIDSIQMIGYITEDKYGCQLITRDNNEFELKAQGWNPLKETK